ncbi:FMN-dependent NADH-azoreductase [Providencia rettgeri]|nr:NAD(P)H-dependent oxidoreductase [Providencia rettgeri]
MSNLLILKSSINGQSSLTNQLIDEYQLLRELAGYQDTIIEHDLTTMALPKLNQSLFSAMRGGDDSSSSVRNGVEISDSLINELKESDLLIIGAPMYNLNVPTDLKKWFDLVVRANKTFFYTDRYPQGLVKGVRAVVISSRGGVHEGQPTDAVTSYLRAALGLIGINDVNFIYAEGMDMKPDGRKLGIANARYHLANVT